MYDPSSCGSHNIISDNIDEFADVFRSYSYHRCLLNLQLLKRIAEQSPRAPFCASHLVPGCFWKTDLVWADCPNQVCKYHHDGPTWWTAWKGIVSNMTRTREAAYTKCLACKWLYGLLTSRNHRG